MAVTKKQLGELRKDILFDLREEMEDVEENFDFKSTLAERNFKIVTNALIKLLILKGVITDEEMKEAIELESNNKYE